MVFEKTDREARRPMMERREGLEIAKLMAPGAGENLLSMVKRVERSWPHQP